jgi:hypothetical protein
LFDGGYANRVLTAKSAEARHVASGAHATAAGTLAIVDHGPRLDLKGSWSEFRWPLAGRDAAVRRARGRYSLLGVLPYRVSIRGEFHAANLPRCGRLQRHADRTASRSSVPRSTCTGVMPAPAARHLGTPADLGRQRSRGRHQPGRAAPDLPGA